MVIKSVISKENQSNLKIILLLISLIFIIYSNSLGNPFLWDDNIFIINNAFIKSWHNFPTLFTTRFFSNNPSNASFAQGGYYRPLITLSFMWDYYCWKLNPLGYHLSNILFHMANVILLFFLLLLILKDKKLSFLTALLYALHPIHTEAIAYIPSRVDLIFTIFYLSSLICYIKSRDGKNKNILLSLSITSFVLSLLSKEMSVTLPFMLFVYEFCFLKEKEGMHKIVFILKRQWFFFAILILYLLIRFTLMPFPADLIYADTGTTLLRLLSMGWIIISYIGLLFFPAQLYTERSIQILPTFFSLPASINIIIFACILAGGFVILRKSRVIFFAYAWFFITIIPVINIIYIHPPMAEHYLYLPSVGFFIILSIFLNKIFKNPKYLLAIVVILILFYGARTMWRNYDYNDEIGFFKNVIKHSPRSFIAHNNLGVLYSLDGNYDLARKEYLTAIQINPRYAEAINNLGLTYKQENKIDQAIEQYRRSLALEPNRFTTHNSLGVAYGLGSQEEKAEEAFKKSIGLNPYFSEGYYNLGALYYRQKKYDQALVMWQKALKLEPQNSFIKDWITNTKRFIDGQSN